MGTSAALLGEPKFGLSLAVPASPPGVRADKLPGGDVFEARCSFLSLREETEQGFQQSGRAELPPALNTRDFIKWQRRELV